MLGGSNFTEAQRDYFFKSAKKEIEQINSLGTENDDSEKWEEIGTNTFSHLLSKQKDVTDSVDEDQLAIIVCFNLNWMNIPT
jgi:molecular chaperone DnaK